MTPAHILNAEETIIGLVQIRGAAAVEECVNLGLSETHFLDRLAGKAFETASIMSQDGVEINLFTLLTELTKNNLLDEGERARFPRIGDAVTGREDISHYVSLIVENARLRAVQRAAAAVANGADDLGELRTALNELASDEGAARTSNPLTYKVREYLSDLTGSVTTAQICSDLGYSSATDKAKVRTVLNRFKGSLITPATGKAGNWRILNTERKIMDVINVTKAELHLWLPLGLHDLTSIHPGDIIVVTGDPNSGKTALLLRIIKENLALGWNSFYFNSEMGEYSLRERLDAFGDFPITSDKFTVIERCADFADVLEPSEGNLNVIDFLEVSDEFYKVGGYLSQIHQKLNGAVAVVAIQKRDRKSDMPLGAQRALEKPRLGLSLRAGNPNVLTILKAKNRKVDYSLDGRKRDFKLVAGCKFIPASDWYS